MKHLHVLVVLSLIALLATTGCADSTRQGGETTGWTSSSANAHRVVKSPSPTSGTATTKATSSSTKSSTPTLSPTAAEGLNRHLEFTCYPADREWGEWIDLDNLQEVWALNREDQAECDAKFVDGPYNSSHMSPLELEAMELIHDEDSIIYADSLERRYQDCARPLLGTSEKEWAEAAEDGWDADWRNGNKAALMLCPDHPDAGRVQELLKTVEKTDATVPDPVFIRAGTYKVGPDIQPGRYVVESEKPMDGCYWERTDATGNIIDNSFLTSGFRAEVTIRPTDYSFTTEGCRPFELQ